MNNNSIYKPDYRYHRLSDIPFEDMGKWGVKAIGLDIDHTIFYDCTFFYVDGAERWLKEAVRREIPMVILSNAGLLRGPYLSKRFGMPYVNFANKPDIAGYKKAADKLNVKPSEIAFIGDRLLTDVRGANEFGAISVYVEPPMVDFMFLLNIKRRAREKALFKSFDSQD